MHRIQLSYCSIDQGFYVRLFKKENEIGEKFFKTETEARTFIKSVSA